MKNVAHALLRAAFALLRTPCAGTESVHTIVNAARQSACATGRESMSAGRILVVDDEPQIRRVMRMTLTGEGYEVEDARTGEEALEKLRAGRYDLALLDWNLPGMGGLETCRQVRSSSDMAIIMLTIRNDERDKVQALDAGADDFITKPFSMPELLARIRAALRRMPLSPEAGPQRITLENVEIDFQTRKAIVRRNRSAPHAEGV